MSSRSSTTLVAPLSSDSGTGIFRGLRRSAKTRPQRTTIRLRQSSMDRYDDAALSSATTIDFTKTKTGSENYDQASTIFDGSIRRRCPVISDDDRLYEDEDWIREVCELWLNRLKTIGGCSLTTTTGSLRTAMTVTIRAMSVDLHGVG